MNCSSASCTTNCIACNGSIAPAVGQNTQACDAPLSAAEMVLLRAYQATVNQRRTVSAADVAANFVCELARGQP